LSETEQAMIRLFGVPAHSATSYPSTIFLGFDLNSLLAKQWLAEACSGSDLPFVFVFLDQLLDPWWIELTDSRIINGHSAVLPYARGMFAIENVAISQNIEAFKKAAGATVHYIDTGIDTGPIIRAERLVDPFRFRSLWEQKGHTFTAVFDLLIEVAKGMLDKPYAIPVGTSPDAKLRGPNFNSRDFTREARKKAEEGYLEMKTLASAKRKREAIPVI
jgi:phosphoribosylglycinamide formyltransferase-1